MQIVPFLGRKENIVKKIARVSNVWLNVSRIILAPLFYEIIPCKCWLVSRLPLLPGSCIKEKVIENGDHIIPIDSSNTWKNPKC